MKKKSTEERLSLFSTTGLLRKMKLMVLFAFVALGSLSAVGSYAQKTELTLKMQHATLHDIIKAVENQSEFVFFYKNEDIDVDVDLHIDLDIEKGNITDVLNRIAAFYSYRIENKQILLLPKRTQQTHQITGTITNLQGEPIIGANITIEGTTSGTITDMDGKFSLEVPAGSTLRVTYIGYLPYLEKISESRTHYPITLKEDFQALDEVVVVGYGTQRRSELTGSITSVKGEQIAGRSAGTLAEALSGMAAGVMVSMTNNSPGNSPSILIRGAASVNGMEPLYIVDGVKQSAGFDFNMRDIESIEILKDAGSAAIYGAQAAGGVVLITTKRGSVEKRDITVNARYGIRKIASNVKMLNRDEFIDAQSLIGRDILLSHGVSSKEELPDIDWMDKMYDTGTEQEYNVSLSEANNKFKFFVSGGFYSQEGVYIDNNAKRFTLRSNIDYQINKHISVGLSLFGNVRTSNPARSGGIPTRTAPTWDPVDESGEFTKAPGYIGGPNPYGNELIWHYKDHNYGLNALAYLNVDIIEGLVFRLNASGRFKGFSNNGFSERADWGAVVNREYMDAKAGTKQDLLYNATLTYEKKLNQHSFKVMAGTEVGKDDGYDINVHATDFPIKIAESLNISSNANKTASDNWPVSRSMSFFGRINYTFNDRYMLTANIRRDGSDKFAPSNRWGTFPSLNVAWRFSEESFVKKALPWLENGKIRASWGMLGNDGIGQFLYSRAYEGSVLYSFGGNGTSLGWGNYKVPNPDIKWEQVNQTDLGLDLTLLNNRLNFVYDYYNRQTKDMLYWSTLPMGSGVGYYDSQNTTMPINIGKVQNIGHEFTLNWNDKVRDFSYAIGINASFNENKVIDLGGEGAILTDGDYNRTESGKPMGMLYGYKALGIFQNQEQVDAYNAKAQAAGQPYYFRPQTGPGDIIYDDMGKGYVSGSSQTYIGDPWPDMTLGLNLHAEWKGFDLTAMFSGAFGFDIYNALKPHTQQFFGDENTTKDIYKTSFFGSNGVTDQPRAGAWIDGVFISDASLGLNYYTISSFWVEKGNYLKLQDLVLGYTLPKSLTQKLNMNKLRFYFTANNVFTLTHYSGLDPEIGGTSSTGSGSVRQRGVESLGRYLPSRQYAFGIDLTF